MLFIYMGLRNFCIKSFCIKKWFMEKILLLPLSLLLSYLCFRILLIQLNDMSNRFWLYSVWLFIITVFIIKAAVIMIIPLDIKSDCYLTYHTPCNYKYLYIYGNKQRDNKIFRKVDANQCVEDDTTTFLGKSLQCSKFES